ncbi:MAG: efflux RND transporter periplasmic adaptor subunit [Kofleriaceae bacterium]
MSSTEPEDLGFQLPPPARGSRIGVIIAVTLVVGAAFGIGILRRSTAHGEVAVVGEAPKPVRVELGKPKLLTSDRALAMPGTVRPLEETQIYSRVTGYVKAWKVDIGDKVAAGQLLVELETPELDAQLSQARAQVAQARASVRQASAQRDYSKSNTARYETLADQKLISRSQVEQTQAQAATDEASVAAAQSNVAAMEANVRRLVDTQGFQKVTAPFAGTITTRNVDRGALVREGATTPMFTLVAMDPVRIFVDVPQSVAPSVKPDTPATVSVREYSGKTFEGKVSRSSGALDLELHTMTTEVRVPNPDGALMPGMYVQVAITLPVPHRVLEIPATALYSDAQGLRVAVVDRTHKVKFAKITIERDTGATLLVATGLTGDEDIIKIAVPTIVEGDTVEVGP